MVPINFELWDGDAELYSNHHVLYTKLMTGWIILYWVLTYLATKGVKAFSNIAKYGVIIASLISLAVMIILAMFG